MTRRLAALLDAPAILAGFSRLVIDCNRDLDDASSIPETSDGVPIPGNRNLAAPARAARQEKIFAPYHAAIDAWLEARRARGLVPAFVSIHSFTPVMDGKARPWHVGILWDSDARIPLPLLAALRSDPSLVVGDNEPYSAREPQGYTVRNHAVARGLPHVAIELRQDLIARRSRRRALGGNSMRRACPHSRARGSLSRGGLDPGRERSPYLGQHIRSGAMDDNTRTELEAASFRRLVEHLRERTDVQNLDLMNLAGFCRNCLSRWYREAAEARGIKLPDPEARKIVYGMPYDEWKAKYQKDEKQPVAAPQH